MKFILEVPDESYSECTWWKLFWVYMMKVILDVPDESYSGYTLTFIKYIQNNFHRVHSE
jgi:hypothetical protein